MLTRGVLLAISPALLIAACGGGSGAPAPGAPAGASTDCREQAARGVTAMFADLSAGRWRAAEQRVTTDGFVWFVLGARRADGSLPRLAVNRTVDLRDGVPAYLRARARRHEEITVRSLRFSEEAAGKLGFELAAVRRADDLAGGRRLPFIAKGEWLCSQDRLSGLAGHAELRGGALSADAQCPPGGRTVAGVRVCG